MKPKKKPQKLHLKLHDLLNLEEDDYFFFSNKENEKENTEKKIF